MSRIFSIILAVWQIITIDAAQSARGLSILYQCVKWSLSYWCQVGDRIVLPQRCVATAETSGSRSSHPNIGVAARAWAGAERPAPTRRQRNGISGSLLIQGIEQKHNHVKKKCQPVIEASEMPGTLPATSAEVSRHDRRQLDALQPTPTPQSFQNSLALCLLRFPNKFLCAIFLENTTEPVSLQKLKGQSVAFCNPLP